LCRQIRANRDIKKSRLPIIFLTARAEEVDRVLGLEIGGDDYITKPFSPRELVARIRSVLRRTEDSESVAVPQSLNSFRIDEERVKIFFQGKPLELSRYEFRLLSILVKRPGRVYSREELMNRAWEEPEMSLERTVDSHIKMIRAKLREIDITDDSIITHRGLGYSLKEDS
jgi:two-component system catabolic regulation response regulator CreB